MIDHFPMPTYGRSSRRHVFKWIREEIAKYLYQPGRKYADMERQYLNQDASWHTGGFAEFWEPHITGYLNRASSHFAAAGEFPHGHPDREHHLARGKQALAKCATTMIDCCESAVRVYGPLPKPGTPSTEVPEPWYDPSYIQHTDPDQPNYVG